MHGDKGISFAQVSLLPFRWVFSALKIVKFCHLNYNMSKIVNKSN